MRTADKVPVQACPAHAILVTMRPLLPCCWDAVASESPLDSIQPHFAGSLARSRLSIVAPLDSLKLSRSIHHLGGPHLSSGGRAACEIKGCDRTQ